MDNNKQKYLKQGALLRECRLKKELTQADIGNQLNISRSHYNRWEKGLHKPNDRYLIQIAEILDIDYHYLSKFYNGIIPNTHICQLNCDRKPLEESLQAVYNTFNYLKNAATNERARYLAAKDIQHHISEYIRKL